MMIHFKSFATIAVALCAASMSGCAHNKDLHSTRDREMTMGIVQKEIRVGMPSPDVVEALGSPNMVRRDSAGKETWVYDKIATEASYSNSSSNVSGGVAGAGVPGDVLLLGTISGGRSGNKGASATTQKTLTVIIRFDLDDKVESFSYHTSTF
jgi:outer membrane protein assembly factor BamE (lipoprotein component of BamABCDE complex)